MSTLLASILLNTSLGIRPPPDYREEKVQEVLTELDALSSSGRLSEVIERGASFEESFEPTSDVAYEMGLAANRLGNRADAFFHYRRAIELEPGHAAARYDRGELWLLEDDLGSAKEDFEMAAIHRPEHWAAHFRLAHVAAAEGDTVGMESHLDRAIATGLNFQLLEADPEWRTWASDEDRGPVLKRVILRYSNEETWKRMGAEP